MPRRLFAAILERIDGLRLVPGMPDGNGPYRGSETWQKEARKHPRVMISRDCGDDVDLNCLESCLPLDSNVASDQPDEAVQRVGGLSSGK